MKCTVKNADVSRELRLLERVVSNKPPIPVLSNVLIRAHENALEMSATDLEVGLVGACLAEVQEPGDITIPAKKFAGIVKKSLGDTIEIASDNKGGVVLKADKFRSRLQTLPVSDFPQMPDMEGDQIELPRDDVKRMLPQVRYAINDSNTRYFLNGSYMGLDTESLLFAAVDGPRLSLTRTSRPGGEKHDPVLVPSKALDELSTLLAEQEEQGTILFSTTDRHIFFEIDGRLMFSRQVDGKFPDYERIIPRGHPHEVTVDRETLVSALERVTLIDDIVRLHVQEGTLGLSSVGVGVGDGSEDVSIDYEGPDLGVRCKGSYLLDFAMCAESPNVTVTLGEGAKKPLLLKDGDYWNVIMPIQK